MIRRLSLLLSQACSLIDQLVYINLVLLNLRIFLTDHRIFLTSCIASYGPIKTKEASFSLFIIPRTAISTIIIPWTCRIVIYIRQPDLVSSSLRTLIGLLLFLILLVTFDKIVIRWSHNPAFILSITFLVSFIYRVGIQPLIIYCYLMIKYLLSELLFHKVTGVQEI